MNLVLHLSLLPPSFGLFIHFIHWPLSCVILLSVFNCIVLYLAIASIYSYYFFLVLFSPHLELHYSHNSPNWDKSSLRIDVQTSLFLASTYQLLISKYLAIYSTPSNHLLCCFRSFLLPFGLLSIIISIVPLSRTLSQSSNFNFCHVNWWCTQLVESLNPP